MIWKIGSVTGINQSRFTTLNISIVRQLVHVRVQLLCTNSYIYDVQISIYRTVEQKRKPYYAVVASAVKPKGLECELDTPCGQRGME